MASRGLNKVMIIGNLGADPETRYMPSGDAVTSIRVATSDTWKDKQSGEQREQTEWHRVVFFRRLAEIAGEYLRKGSKVYIEGRLRTNKWQAQDGSDRYSTEIVASDMQMLDSRAGGTANFEQDPVQQSSPMQPPAATADSPMEQSVNDASPPSGAKENTGFEDFDDDIPF